VMWGKSYSVKVRRYSIQVDFKNIGGLGVGADVLANGVKAGRVRDIALHEGKVTVMAEVDKNVSIYSDYKIVIESPTLMAGKILAIYPGGQQPLTDVKQPLHGDDPLGMSEGISMVQNLAHDIQITLQKLNSLLESLDEIAGDSANQQHVAGMLKSASEMTKLSSEWMLENKAAMSTVIEKLESTLIATEKMVNSTESQVGTTLTTINTAVQDMDTLSASLHGMMQKLEAGEGTMGKLLTDDELYVRMNKTLAEVDSLAKSIRTKGLRNKIVLF
jgi:phospholipid/cholesterol/gamma-HCH transport system substrate-binding protein